MTFNLDQESLITFRDLAKNLPLGKGGRPVSISTLHRWRIRGIAGGIKLEAIRVGGRWCTSRAAFDRFNARVTAAKSASPSIAGSNISSDSSLSLPDTPLW